VVRGEGMVKQSHVEAKEPERIRPMAIEGENKDSAEKPSMLDI